MFFPLQISGKRKVYIDSNSQDYTRSYLDDLRKYLKDAGARNIVQSDHEISFKGPLFSFKIYDLRLITYGYVSVSSKGNEIIISYIVRYTYLFIFCSLAMFGFLLPSMLVNHPESSIILIIFSLVGWLWVYGFNIALPYSCFRKCIINSQ